jgi:hypothetical protein
VVGGKFHSPGCCGHELGIEHRKSCGGGPDGVIETPGGIQLGLQGFACLQVCLWLGRLCIELSTG